MHVCFVIKIIFVSTTRIYFLIMRKIIKIFCVEDDLMYSKMIKLTLEKNSDYEVKVFFEFMMFMIWFMLTHGMHGLSVA